MLSAVYKNKEPGFLFTNIAPLQLWNLKKEKYFVKSLKQKAQIFNWILLGYALKKRDPNLTTH